jgi:hypothetical protein
MISYFGIKYMEILIIIWQWWPKTLKCNTKLNLIKFYEKGQQHMLTILFNVYLTNLWCIQQSFQSLMQILEMAVFFATVCGIYFSYLTMLNNCTSTDIYTYTYTHTHTYIYIYICNIQVKLVTETDIKFTPVYTVSEKDIKLPIYWFDKDQPAIIKQNLVMHIEMVMYVHSLY